MCGCMIIFLWDYPETGMIVKVHTHTTCATKDVLFHHDVRHILLMSYWIVRMLDFSHPLYVTFV